MDVAAALQEVYRLGQAGDRARARRLLEDVLRVAPDHEGAWYLMAQLAPDPAEARRCLERVLVLNPDNAKARQRLARLDAPAATIPAAASAVPAAPLAVAPAPHPAAPPPRRAAGLGGLYVIGGLICLLLLILVGLQATVAQLLDEQNARDAQSSPPTTWEYTAVIVFCDLDGKDDCFLFNYVNDRCSDVITCIEPYGKAGWEMISLEPDGSFSYYILFKRPLAPAAPSFN